MSENGRRKTIYKIKNSEWLKYFVALCIPTFSSVLRLTLLGGLGAKVPYITFYPAVIVAALYGGLVSGGIATITSAFFATLWIEPIGKIAVISQGSDWLGMAVFIMSCTMISIITEAMHRTQARLEQRTAELVEARDQAQTANAAKSIFLANMSHELRTPLNSILGYSQLMKRDTSLPYEDRQYLDIINRSGEHLLNLINEVLEIAKIEARHVNLELVTFDLTMLLREVEDMFRDLTASKGLRFHVVGINDLPCYLVLDEKKLRVVLINLLGNSVKFTETGYIELRVTIKKQLSEKMLLIFEVEDTGAGIAANELGNLFTSFEQTETGKLNKTGTGLGLAISQSYVNLMGGAITVSSSIGKGSIFSFELIVKQGSEDELTSKPHLRIITGLEPGLPVPRVLVVEDTKESRELLTKLLQVVGFQVMSANNGMEAVEIFQQWEPDFIWMDIRMPVMDELEATKIIKARELGKNTKIVALTAHVLNEEKEIILSVGCDDFVRKPYREAEIFEVMERQLGLKYVYLEEESGIEQTEKVTELTIEHLKTLPKETLEELHQATLKLDTTLISVLIEKIISADISIGSSMKKLSENMDYSGLLSLLEEIKSIKGE